MTLRKPRQPAVQPAPLPKAVPYPPESIWSTWLEDTVTVFRGNTFMRKGRWVTRVFDVPADENT